MWQCLGGRDFRLPIIRTAPRSKPRAWTGKLHRELPEGVRRLKDDLHDDIVRCLPHLRAFAFLLARDRALADDLVQDAVLRALSHAHQFTAGTNFKAWITTILRNSYFNEMRRRARAAQMSIDNIGNTTGISGGQMERLHTRDFERAFYSLPAAQREALALVGASGFVYEEAAKVASCAVGTMKSRVSRARAQLQQMLDGNNHPALQRAGDGPHRPAATDGAADGHGRPSSRDHRAVNGASSARRNPRIGPTADRNFALALDERKRKQA
jgi:RNA polymerase sigma-70 factor (ECF subfamily)